MSTQTAPEAPKIDPIPNADPALGIDTDGEEGSQTELAEPEAPARGRKRPGSPKRPLGKPPSSQSPAAAAPKPLRQIRPPHVSYGINLDSGRDAGAGRRANDFFSWWAGLADSDKKRCMVYVYRIWPVGFSLIKNQKTGSTRQSRQVARTPAEDAITSVDEFKRRFGSGDFSIDFNEQVIQKKTICHCGIRIQDMEQFPPHIPDLGWLDLSHPANKSFIESLRLRGVEIPGDPGRRRDHEQEEADDMANVQAVEALTGTVERLSDRVIRSAEERAAQDRTPSGPQSAQAQADTRSVDLVSKAAETGFELLRGIVAGQGAAHSDPLSGLKEVVGVVKDISDAIRPEKDSSPGVLMELFRTAMGREADLNTKLQNLQAAQIASLEARMERMLARLETAQAQSAPAANQGLLGQLKEMSAVKEALRDFLGLEEEEGPAARGPRAPSLLETAIAQAPAVLQGLGSLVSSVAIAWHNAAVVRTGQGTPIAVPMSIAEPETPQGELPPGAAEPLAETPEEIQRRTQEAQLSAIQTAVRELEEPLDAALKEGKTGDEFAEELIRFKNRVAYEQIRELGREAIIIVLRSYAPKVWQTIMQAPQHFETFINEFLNAEELIAKREAEEDSQATLEAAGIDGLSGGPLGDSASLPRPRVVARPRARTDA